MSGGDKERLAQGNRPMAPPTVDENEEVWTAKAEAFHSATPHSPVPQLEFLGTKFAAIITCSLLVLIGLMLIFVRGVTIDRDVKDPLGSSKHAEERVELYQTINGYITATIGELIENAFEIFVAVAVLYLGNCRLHPGDEPQRGANKYKRFFLAALPPVLMFLLNVAISATFIQHKAVRIERVFQAADLKATAMSASANVSLTTTGAGVSVQDTILRSAVRHNVVPFQILADSPCVLANGTKSEDDDGPSGSSLPTLRDIKSTAVVFGFPTQQWNLDAIPKGLKPLHAIKFSLSDVNATGENLVEKFAEFQKQTSVSWLTTYELLLQGTTLFERSVSDSNVSATYPCVLVDGQTQLEPKGGIKLLVAEQKANADAVNNATNATSVPPTTPKPSHRRRLQEQHRQPKRRWLQDAENVGESDLEEGDPAIDDPNYADDFDRYDNSSKYKGLRKCYGAKSSLPALANITDPAMHSMDVFVDLMVSGIITTLPAIEPESMDLTFETYEINPQMQLTSMTIDIPFLDETRYRDVTDICTKDGKLNGEAMAALNATGDGVDIEAVTALLCDQRNYPYLDAKYTCGHTNCIFLDKSGTVPFKKQLQLMPYLKNCSTGDMTYNSEYLNYFPRNCQPQEDAVFLYGMGTYMSGAVFNSGISLGTFPVIVDARRHVVLTFAKLEWKLQDLSARFKATCDVPHGCDGLLHKLENVSVPFRGNETKGDKYARVLMAGKTTLPKERMDRDFKNPVQLVSVNTRPFYYAEDQRYYEWEYLDKRFFNETDWPKNGGLNGTSCSPVIDAYITQVESNHFFLDNPTQPLYTSALFYLFQDAAVKTVKLTKDAATGGEFLEFPVVGTTNLNGDLEIKEIKFSIPLLSLISTFIGLGSMLFLTALVLLCPAERLKRTEETNIAATYAQVLIEDEYPDDVCERTLVLPSGERLNMDEYNVDSITFHHERDEDKKVFL